MKRILLYFFALLLITSVEAQQQFTNFASKNTITSLADKGSQMWIGTSGGLYVRSKSTGAIILTYTIANGLPSSYVNDVVVDPFDNVWVATRKGVAKFDGSSWTTYDQSSGLPYNLINGITIDQSGSVWVYSFWKTLSKLESNDTWTNYTAADGFPSQQPNCIATGPNGNIWIGTYGGGAYDFNIATETFTQHAGHFGTYDRVYDIIVDASSDMWFAAYSGLFKYNGATYTEYTTADGLASNLSVALSSDAAGFVWVGSASQGVTKFDPTGVGTVVYNESNGLGHNYVDAVAVDSDGKVWMGTRYGLNRYDVAGDSWNEYLVNNSLSNNEVKDIKVDASNNVWVGTEYGLSKLTGSSWTNWFASDGLIQDRVTCLDVNGTDVWTGSNYGLTHFDGSTTFTTYGSGNGITQVKDVLINTDGSVWAACNSGLIHFDGTTTTTYTTADGLVANGCQTLMKDGSGNLWVGTTGGVSMWNGSNFTNYTTADGLSQNSTHGLSLAANGDIWAMCNAQVSIYNGATWTTSGFNTTYEMAQSADGNFWLANYWGIKKYDGTNTATYTSDDGLADDVIYDVAIGSAGVNWFGTLAGLIKAECETPVPGFTNNVACLPGVTTFTNTSTSVDETTTYEWDINNDGSVEYTTFEPTHTFTVEGTVSVKLTVHNDDCSEVIILDVTTYDTPFVTLSPSGNVDICSGSSVEIVAQGAGNLTPVATEDFNYADLAASGWTNGGDATTNWTIAATENAGGTTPELRMTYNPSYDGYGYAASPVMDMSAHGDLNLSFTYYVDDYSGGYTIGVKTSSNGADWNTVWSQAVSADVPVTTESISISNADVGSATFQIAFYLEGNSFNIDNWYIDDVVLSATAAGTLNPAYTFEWSTLSTASSITVSTADTYTVTVSNASCTYEPAAVTVNLLEPILPTICMVMVDTSQGKNLIVWEKPATGSIDYFNIYKEVTTDNYQVIGSKFYAEISEFTDFTSTPDVNADKYKISVVDTCGNESDLSPYHQTMLLSQVQGAQADELVLIWNKYVDESGTFVPSTYDVYRGVDPTNMTLETALTGGLSSYNYNALSVVDNEKFLVVIDMSTTCTPTTGAKATGGPYYQSTSNLEDEGIINTSINNPQEANLNIFPNPVNKKAIISSDVVIKNINIYNLSGELVRQYTDINSTEFEILREDMASGAYFIEINNLFRDKLIFE